MSSSTVAILLFLFSLMLLSFANAGTMEEALNITWGDSRGKFLDNGELLTLSLDNYSGSGFQSKDEYLFGRIDVQIKLVGGDSAGTVTTFFLSSQGPTHDEIDFEFLGNISGNPYIVHTNVFSKGQGNREQQFYLWFDPTKDFHTYSILWNPQHIILLVDNIPIRDFKNMEAKGVPFPKEQPMRMYSSLWNADQWATMGGRVKTNWTLSPFTAYFRNYRANACTIGQGNTRCVLGEAGASGGDNGWMTQGLDSMGYRRMRSVQRKYMIYNYCSHSKGSTKNLPPECKAR